MPTAPSHPESPRSDWTTARITELVERRYQKRPCWYQIEAAKAFYAGRDVIGCAPTGAGKTLSFWIPLLMAQEDKKKKILFVISPLNVLAKQNVETLVTAGIPAIAVAAENATSSTFRDIENGKYEVVVTNPEILVASDELKELWKKSSFTRRLLGFVFDEGHCITQWGRFRKHYLAVGIIRYLIADPVPFYVASATLPPTTIAEIRRLLHINPANLTEILCSNERGNIALMVRELSSPSSSYEDLAFLIPYNWQEGMNKPKKFIVFFDDIKEAEQAKRYFHNRLVEEHHSKIAWFHSTMSQQYRERMVEQFREGNIWGLFCTDAFGLGMDLGDIEVVVQYKATCDLCTLWQRFGRAARAAGISGFGILLVEKRDTVHGRKGISVGSKRKSKDLQKNRRTRARLQTAKEDEREETTTGDITCQPVGTLTSPSHSHDQGTWARERQDHYQKPEIAPNDPKNARKGKAPGVLPGSAMDDYINIPDYISCRRLVPQLYFANNKRSKATDSHHRCDPVQPGGCPRCRLQMARVCCDRCHPDQFSQFFIPPSLKRNSTRRSTIPVVYTKSPQHPIVQEAIYKWRHTQAVKHLGVGSVHRLGARILMSDEVISRILACWTFGKITEVSHLNRETNWPDEWVQLCGESLVILLATHSPFAKPEQFKVEELLTEDVAVLPPLNPDGRASPNGPSSRPWSLSAPQSNLEAMERLPNYPPPLTFNSCDVTMADPPIVRFDGTADVRFEPRHNIQIPAVPPEPPHNIPAPQVRPRSRNRCGQCKQIGHNQTERSCKISKKVKEELIDYIGQENTPAIPEVAATMLASTSQLPTTDAQAPSKLPLAYQYLCLPNASQQYFNWTPRSQVPHQAS